MHPGTSSQSPVLAGLALRFLSLHHKNGPGRGEIVTFCLDPIKRSLRRDESPRAPLCAASGWKKAEAAFEGEKEVSLLGPLQAFKAGVIALFLNSQIKEAPASFPSR